MKRKRFSVEQIAAVLQQIETGIPVNEVCRQVGIAEQTFCQVLAIKSAVSEPTRSADGPLRGRIREVAHARIRFGYRRLGVLLKREGWEVGTHRFYRVYVEEGLAFRRKRPWRHATAVHREQRRSAHERNEVWRMDFVSDELADGRRFRALTVIDLFTRECLAIAAGAV